MLTPTVKISKLKPHASHNPGLIMTPTQDLNNLRLSFDSVIGTTTDSANAFDSLPEYHTIAYCAGSATVLTHVDEQLNLTQRLFRVRPNVSPVNATPAFYNPANNPATPPSTPGKSRYGSHSKDVGYEMIHPGLQDYHSKSPGQIKATNRNRQTSCLSLSRRGDLMAVGEVNRPAPKVCYCQLMGADGI